MQTTVLPWPGIPPTSRPPPLGSVTHSSPCSQLRWPLECLNLARFSRHQHHTHLGLDFGRFWAPRPQAAKGLQSVSSRDPSTKLPGGFPAAIARSGGTGQAAQQTAQACAGAERRPDGTVCGCGTHAGCGGWGAVTAPRATLHSTATARVQAAVHSAGAAGEHGPHEQTQAWTSLCSTWDLLSYVSCTYLHVPACRQRRQ